MTGRFFGLIVGMILGLALGLTLGLIPGLTPGVSGQSAAEEQIVGPSGSLIPRFISMAAKKAYMRTGPGLQYPVVWVYSRTGLPLMVVDEDGPWRKLRDPDGAEGWIHVSLLSGRRTALIIGGAPKQQAQRLYAEPAATSKIRLTAETGVIGQVLECQALWCRLEIEGTKAWIERRHLWGVFEGEVVK